MQTNFLNNIVVFYFTRISFYYIPNEMTKAKYGTKSDLAIVLDLFTDHVRNSE